ncbi:GDSL-type esterase/lipase family protein, partial [Streptomyces sp. NPDC058953]
MTELPTEPPPGARDSAGRRGRGRTVVGALCALVVLPVSLAVGSPAATANPGEGPVPQVTGPAVAQGPGPVEPPPPEVPRPDITTAGEPDPAPVRPVAVVTIGDGFLAGEGARWAGNAQGLRDNGGIPPELRDATDRTRTPGVAPERIYTSDCRRSDVLTLGTGTLRHHNIACSGAGTEALSRAVRSHEAQLEQLRKLAAEYDVRAVVVSIGGDDVRLTDTMKACAEQWRADRYCSTDPRITDPAAERVAAVEEKVVTAVASVREAVRGTGSAPRVVVQSYPLPLASGEPGVTTVLDENGWDRWSVAGCPFYNRDLRWLATDVGGALNTRIRAAARRSGADFVNVARLLEGHQVCGAQPLRTAFAADGTIAAPAADRAEWARYVPRTAAEPPADEAREVLHPNYYGQRALKHCLQ